MVAKVRLFPFEYTSIYSISCAPNNTFYFNFFNKLYMIVNRNIFGDMQLCMHAIGVTNI